MVYVSHVDYRELVQKHGKRCANAECGKKGKKPASEFNVARDRYDGLQAYCKVCSRVRQQASRKKEKPEQQQARKKRFHKKHPDAIKIYAATYHAKKKKKRKVEGETRKEAQRRRKFRNAELRAQMDLNDRMYAIPQSLCGSSLGPHVSD
jgi:hypothetical protein